MPAAELRTLIEGIDWDTMFGSSNYEFKNIRRKADARAYPSHIEFGLKKGVGSPTAINDGQQVDFLLLRIGGMYYELDSFDTLPTPFRAVASDLVAAQPVVMSSGSLAVAMRASMSLPGIFPPIEVGNQVLVDGGAFDNVPADVVHSMGANTVIAVNVGSAPQQEISYSMFGLLGLFVDAMMRANTARGQEAADIKIDVNVEGFGSLDWRRSAGLIERGYQAAESKRDELLKLAVPEAEYQAWAAARQARRRLTMPAIDRLERLAS